MRNDRLIKKDQVYDRLGKLDLVERKRRETEGLFPRDTERERERERGEDHRYARPHSRHIATKIAVMVDRS